MIEYALLTAKSTIETLLINLFNWIESIPTIIRGVIPDFLVGVNFSGIFGNVWVLVIIAGLVLMLVLQVRR